MTFVQFLFVAITGYISQFDLTRPPFFIKKNRVPISRWLINIVLFFSINVLNNHAFSYDISVPVHIILRSGGSITTMIAGSLYGKRYSRIQIVAVLLLTVGVVTAAWSDAQSKARRTCLLLLRSGPPTTNHVKGNKRQRPPRRCAQVQHRPCSPLDRANFIGHHGIVY